MGIETSCDDTGVAILDDEGKVLGECLSSQWGLLAKYQGIYPNHARLAHTECIDYVIQSCLEQADCALSDLGEKESEQIAEF